MTGGSSLLGRLGRIAGGRRPWRLAALAFLGGALIAAALTLVLLGPGGLGTTSAQGLKPTLISNTAANIPQGQASGVGAFCPAGSHVTGGGYAVAGASDPAGVFVTFAAPVAASLPKYPTESYGVTVNNVSGGDAVSITAYAVCAGN
jgi:hypothetical protein